MNRNVQMGLLCSLLLVAGPSQALDLWGSVKGIFGSDKTETKAEAKTESDKTGEDSAATPAAAEPQSAPTSKSSTPMVLDPAPGVVDLNLEDFLDRKLMSKKDMAVMEKVVVGGFRVAFATKATVSDSVRSSYMPGGIHKSGVNSKIEITLEGMDLARMQSLVDQAYQDFLTQLQAQGIQRMDYAAFAEHPAFAEIEAAKAEEGKPYTVTEAGRTYVVLSPTGMKLWFDQAEQLGDQGAFGWGNGRRAGDFAYDHKALVLNPMLVVDFAETASARNKGLFGVRDETDVEAKAGMSLSRGASKLYVRGRAAPVSSAVMGGVAYLKENVVFAGRFGQLEMGEVSSNRGLVVGLALVGLSAGPVRTNQKGVLRADPTRFEEYAGNLLRTGNRLFARAMGDVYR